MFTVRILIDGQLTELGELTYVNESDALDTFNVTGKSLELPARKDMDQEVTIQVSDSAENVIAEGTWQGDRRVG